MGVRDREFVILIKKIDFFDRLSTGVTMAPVLFVVSMRSSYIKLLQYYGECAIIYVTKLYPVIFR